MINDPRHPIRDDLRRFLGTADLLTALHRMENTMATWQTVLNGLVEQTTAASAAQATSFHNLQGAIDRQGDQIDELKALLADGGEVTPEMQAKADEISQALTDMKAAADAADDGFEPVVEQPQPEQPTDGADSTVEVPATADVRDTNR
jgi:hypothetical protein